MHRDVAASNVFLLIIISTTSTEREQKLSKYAFIACPRYAAAAQRVGTSRRSLGC